MYEVPGAQDDTKALYGRLEDRQHRVWAGGFPASDNGILDAARKDVPQYTYFVCKSYAMMSGALPEGADGYPDRGFEDDDVSSSDESVSVDGSFDLASTAKVTVQDMDTMTKLTHLQGPLKKSSRGSPPSASDSEVTKNISPDVEAAAATITAEAKEADVDITTKAAQEAAKKSEKRAIIEKAVKAAQEAQKQASTADLTASKESTSSIAASAAAGEFAQTMKAAIQAATEKEKRMAIEKAANLVQDGQKRAVADKAMAVKDHPVESGTQSEEKVPGLSRAEKRAAEQKKAKATKKQLRKELRA